MSKETTVNVDGMTCSHCETAIVNAVKKLQGVTDAKASHNNQKVIITHEGELDKEEVRKKVAEAGYTFIS